jgi:hypothetical protein
LIALAVAAAALRGLSSKKTQVEQRANNHTGAGCKAYTSTPENIPRIAPPNIRQFDCPKGFEIVPAAS